MLSTTEREIVVWYDWAHSKNDVNCSKQFFITPRRRDIEKMPLTWDALVQHLLCVGC